MLKEGKEIKDFTLKKFLGRGGFGEVWLAEKKIEISDKKVSFALKFIQGANGEDEEIAKVKREINTWIDASGNKNVLTVLDGFAYEDHFVIVSEYADNGSLRDWLKAHGGRSPSVEKTVEIMGGVLDGLSHLHAQKIVHRDLKPENVLLKGDVPCIADFGVSKVVETVSLTNSELGTNTAGSPLYMSPESFERIKPTPQIDIWSAGVMLFEMLSGKTPYAGDTIPALIFEIVTKEPRELPPDVPQSIRSVVRKSLAKELSERFVSAKEMREALLRALYLKDFSSDELESETVAPGKTNAVGQDTISRQMTVPMNAYIPETKKKPGGAGKGLALTGIGAAFALAAAAGIYTWTNSSAGNPNQNGVSISNQKSSETNAGSANNSVNQQIVVEKPANTSVENNIAEKSKETVKAEAPRQPAKEEPKQAGKAEANPKRDAPPKTAKPKKGGLNLDDLIKKN